jgi:putative membrane protein
MRLVIRLLINALAVMLGAYLIPGIEVSSFFSAIIVAIVLAILNTFIKPILVILTIPITILTLGIFLLFINVAMIKLAGILILGFEVNGFWPALFFSFFLSVVGWLFIDRSDRN